MDENKGNPKGNPKGRSIGNPYKAIRKVKRDDACWCSVCDRPVFWSEIVLLKSSTMWPVFICNKCWSGFDYTDFIPYNRWLTSRPPNEIRDILSLIYTRRPWVKAATWRHKSWNVDEKGRMPTKCGVRVRKVIDPNVVNRNNSDVDILNYLYGKFRENRQERPSGVEGVLIGERAFRRRNVYVERLRREYSLAPARNDVYTRSTKIVRRKPNETSAPVLKRKARNIRRLQSKKN